MKKLFTTSALILLTTFCYSQNLVKGNVIGQHVGTIVLNPDVTYNQYKSFFLTKYIPEFNKLFNGELTASLAEGERGGEKNSISFLYVFKSVDTRNKYFPAEGSSLDPVLAAKLKALDDQLIKLGAFSEKFYTDWVVQ